MYDALIEEVRAADEEFEERAAIIEYDGGHTRREAERLAWCLLCYGRAKINGGRP